MTSSTRIAEFDIWRPGYGNAVVRAYLAGTTTLADVFSDEDLTVPAANPITLDALEIGGIVYGRFSQPLYVGDSYYLDLDNTDQTGVIRPPLTTLVGADAAMATVRRTGQSVDTPLGDIQARMIWVEDFGSIGDSSATNTATLNSAIGVAAAEGGGRVMLPAGAIPFTSLTLPAGVVLYGAARGVTILQCQTADQCVTLSGDGAGLSRLTLDGVNKVTLSTGVYSKARSETVLDDVEIMRFATGLHCRGGRRARWRDLVITNCATGAKLHGDLDASGDTDGDNFEENRWQSGVVRQCGVLGVDLSYEDAPCRHNSLIGVSFLDNTGVAVRINGARFSILDDCCWSGNTTNLEVLDDTDTTPEARAENTTVSLRVIGGSMTDGLATFDGTCQNIVFDNVRFSACTLTAGSAENTILRINCIDDAAVLINGVTRWLSEPSNFDGTALAFTTDAVSTKVWGMEMVPGGIVFVEAVVLAVPNNGVGTCEYHIEVSAKRPGSILLYDSQTADFTVGDILVGQTSGATGRLIAMTDNGGTGDLTLRAISGEFVDNEIIVGTSAGGSATVNGTLTAQNVTLLGSVTDVRPPREDVAGRSATFVASASEIELQVAGSATSDFCNWICRMRVTA